MGLSQFTEIQWAKLTESRGAGSEFDWFARDREGHLAIFTSAGSGPVPNSTWRYLHQYNQLARYVESLPRNGFIQELHDEGRYEDWQDFATLGLFGFDYQDVHRVQKRGGYERITRPTLPLQTSRVPAELLAWVAMLDTSFSTAPFVPDRVVLAAESYA